ncbi:unnamed protein product [Blepharisma stoltei]|uniref:PX domain-containing protein n=1 Tax=Blepharisma stoltei TaxID=1481888 RepID=A0AAU9ISR1_9CILI|nr:unnamed protein product [Blepharisma stoltei]
MDSDSEDILESAQRKAKQKFLREEVIELNYDPKLFTDFCESQKGSDIDLWTFEEIQECVKEFKLKFRPGETAEEYEEKVKKEKELERRLYEIPPKKVQKAVEEYKQQEEAKAIMETKAESLISPGTDPNGDVFFVHTETAEVNELMTFKDIKLEISEPVIVQGGLFGSNYVMYNIVTSPLGWNVRRRYKQFEWLREVLAHEFPGYYIPPLPDKKAHGNTEDMTILKRQRFLQRYMNSLISNPVFRSSPSFVLFLKESSTKEFKSSKDHNKKTKRNTVDQFVSLKGEVNCDVRDHTLKINAVNQYLNTGEIIKKKLKRQSEEIIEDLIKLSKTIASYAETVRQAADFQDLLDFNVGHKELYKNINDALLEWSNWEANKANFISDYFNMFFKFGYMELGTLKEIIKERDAALANFKKTGGGDSDKRKKAREWYGFYNHQSVSEVERVILNSRNVTCEHISEMASNQIDSALKLKGIWENLLSSTLTISDRYSFFG